MKIILIILVVIAVCLFMFKDKIKKMIDIKRKTKTDLPDNVYVPVGLSRTFILKIEIEETGGGNCKISIAKDKE